MEADKIQIVLEAIERGRAQMEAVAKRIDNLTNAGKRNEKATRDQDKTLLGMIPTWAKVGAAVTAATLALTAWVRTAINGADATRRQAENIGTVTDKLSAFKFAADIADIGANEMVNALGFMNRALGEVGDKTSTTGRLLQQLGINAKDPIDATLQLADAFQKSNDIQAKTQISMALFGRSGREMISFLNQGSGAIRDQMERARELGGVFSNELGVSADMLNDKITEIKTVFLGWAIQVATEITPTLVAIADVILDLVANKELMINATSAVVAIFTTLVQVLIVLKAGFDTNIAIVKAVIAIYAQLVFQITQVYLRVYDLIRAMGGLGDVFRRVASGDFTGAWEAAKLALGTMKDAAGEVKNAVVDVFKVTGQVAVETATDLKTELIGIGTTAAQTISGLQKKSTDVRTSAKRGPTPLGTGTLPRVGGPIGTPAQQGFEQFLKGLNGMENQAQLTANVLQTTLGGAIKGISDGIYGLVTGTATWGQVFLQVGAQVLSTLIQIGVEMIAQWVLRQTIGAALQTQAAAEGATIAASYAPAAAVAGAATYGIGTVIGVALTVAAIVAAIASLAFAEGGIVPGAPSHRDNRIAQVASGELILSTAATQAIIRQGGMGAVASLMGGNLPYGADFAGGYVPRSSGHAFAAGGIVGPAGDAAGRMTNVDITLAEIRNRQDERELAARETAPIIIDRLNRRGNKIRG